MRRTVLRVAGQDKQLIPRPCQTSSQGSSKVYAQCKLSSLLPADSGIFPWTSSWLRSSSCRAAGGVIEKAASIEYCFILPCGRKQATVAYPASSTLAAAQVPMHAQLLLYRGHHRKPGWLGRAACMARHSAMQLHAGSRACQILAITARFADLCVTPFTLAGHLKQGFTEAGRHFFTSSTHPELRQAPMTPAGRLSVTHPARPK